MENLSQPTGLSFRFKQGKDISFTDRSLHISDDLSIAFSNELDLDLEQYYL